MLHYVVRNSFELPVISHHGDFFIIKKELENAQDFIFYMYDDYGAPTWPWVRQNARKQMVQL